MFWGLTLEAGKHYSQSVEDSFHVSMAALELQYDYKDRSIRPPVQVMVQHQKKDFLLCSLLHGTLVQQPLDLDFTEGEQVTFYLEGTGAVHLTGYLVQEKPFEAEEELILGSPPDSSEDGMEVSDNESDAKDDTDESVPSLQQLATGKDLESGDESEEDWTPVQKEFTKKRKLVEGTPSFKKKTKSEQDDEDESSGDEEEDEDITNEIADLFEDIDAHSNGSSSNNQNNGKEEEAGDTEKTTRKKKKKKKKQQQEGCKPIAKLTTQNKNKTAQTPCKLKRKLSSGVIVEDIVVGEGKLARPLKMVGVYYRGSLAGKKQEFDSCLSGKPFRFRLGTKEVISGWDVGLSGMRVGGKRKLTIPPSQGYGKSRTGSIPPNSTLVFDVELKEVR